MYDLHCENEHRKTGYYACLPQKNFYLNKYLTVHAVLKYHFLSISFCLKAFTTFSKY